MFVETTNVISLRKPPTLPDFLIGIVLGLLLSATAHSDDSSSLANSKVNENPLKIHASLLPAEVKFGDTIEVTLNLDLDSRYHAYKEKFELRLIEPVGITIAPFTLSPILKFFDKLAKTNREGIHDRADLKTKFRVPSSLALGTHKAIFEVKYQACADTHCLFPKKITVEIPFEVISQNPTSLSEKTASLLDLSKRIKTDPISAFLLVFLAGLLTSLTPCIFPLIPITLSVLGVRATKHDSHHLNKFSSRGLVISIFYVLGIGMTYATLGVFAATSGMIFGSLLGSPILASITALIFVAMGLSMYGLFEIQAPAFLRNQLQNQKTGNGYVGAFASGLIAGIVAGPCVGPVLVGILAFIAKTQSVVLGFTFLFTYALGFGFLFIVFGAFSGLLRFLPKSGSWMEAIKFVFGTSMIGVALYVIYPVVSDKRYFLALTSAVIVLISSSFGAFDKNPKRSILGRIKKGLLLMAFVVGLAIGIRALVLDDVGPLKLSGPIGPNSNANNLPWKKFSIGEFDAALGKGRPVILDFWAEWCLACKELESYTYSDPKVKAEATDFELFSFDATSESEELTKVTLKYGIVGLPTLLFFSGNGTLIESETLSGFESGDQFASRLIRVKALKPQ